MKKIKDIVFSAVGFLANHKSSVSLFVIMLGVTLLTAVVASLCGACELTKVVMSASAGVIALMSISSLEELVGMKLGDNKRPAILGIIMGIWVILI